MSTTELLLAINVHGVRLFGGIVVAAYQLSVGRARVAKGRSSEIRDAALLVRLSAQSLAVAKVGIHSITLLQFRIRIRRRSFSRTCTPSPASLIFALKSDETGRASFEKVFDAGEEMRRHFHEVSNPCPALGHKHEEAGVKGSVAATAHGKRVGEIVGDQIARQILTVVMWALSRLSPSPVRMHVRSRATTAADTFDTDGVPISCSCGSGEGVGVVWVAPVVKADTYRVRVGLRLRLRLGVVDGRIGLSFRSNRSSPVRSLLRKPSVALHAMMAQARSAIIVAELILVGRVFEQYLVALLVELYGLENYCECRRLLLLRRLTRMAQASSARSIGWSTSLQAIPCTLYSLYGCIFTSTFGSTIEFLESSRESETDVPICFSPCGSYSWTERV
ncbi:hypothetical protein KCU95_g58, partial [Aureobasidium melanogenum]